MRNLQEIMAKIKNMETTFKEMSPREYEQFKVDGLNNTEGNRHLTDGYNCKLCKNKGYIVKLIERPNGTFEQEHSFCKCEDIRRSIVRMKKSGLKDIIKDYTFDKYEVTEPWQEAIKSAAVEYAKNPVGWFFLGGQSGAGKTHLCTAICREFLLGGRKVVYMLWRDDISKLKSLAKENPEEREAMIEKFKKAEVLYIDDLFKMGKATDNAKQMPTAADINAAFEIINYRYNNPNLLTIVSSECSEDELLDIDEAVGGRIFERAKTISIAKNRDRNYRIRKAVTL